MTEPNDDSMLDDMKESSALDISSRKHRFYSIHEEVPSPVLMPPPVPFTKAPIGVKCIKPTAQKLFLPPKLKKEVKPIHTNANELVDTGRGGYPNKSSRQKVNNAPVQNVNNAPVQKVNNAPVQKVNNAPVKKG